MACHNYRPDHNGECLNCDEGADAHPRDAFTLPIDGLYAVARDCCHAQGIAWIDPRTGRRYPPPPPCQHLYEDGGTMCLRCGAVRKV